jgi:hypothetical protein
MNGIRALELKVRAYRLIMIGLDLVIMISSSTTKLYVKNA